MMDMIDRLVVDEGELVFEEVDSELTITAPIAKPEVFGMYTSRKYHDLHLTMIQYSKTSLF